VAIALDRATMPLQQVVTQLQAVTLRLQRRTIEL
jgi:hypothetical protein